MILVSFVSWSDFRLVFVRVSFLGANSVPFVSDLQAIRGTFFSGGMIG